MGWVGSGYGVDCQQICARGGTTTELAIRDTHIERVDTPLVGYEVGAESVTRKVIMLVLTQLDSQHTRRAYVSDYRQLFEFLGHSDLRAVRREDMQLYLAWLKQELSTSTVRRKLSAVRQLFAEVVANKVRFDDPCYHVKGPRRTSERSKTKSPSFDEVVALLDSIETDTLIGVRDYAMIYLMATFGLRRAEVCDLKVSSVSRDQGYDVLMVVGKGNKGRLERFPDNGNALSAVRNWISAVSVANDDELFRRIVKQKQKYIIGQPLTENGLSQILKKRFAAVGIEGCSPHSLRHFAITNMLRRGNPLHKVQQVAGHADPKTTTGYDHSRDDLDDSPTADVGF